MAGSKYVVETFLYHSNFAYFPPPPPKCLPSALLLHLFSSAHTCLSTTTRHYITKSSRPHAFSRPPRVSAFWKAEKRGHFGTLTLKRFYIFSSKVGVTEKSQVLGGPLLLIFYSICMICQMIHRPCELSISQQLFHLGSLYNLLGRGSVFGQSRQIRLKRYLKSMR